MKIIALPTGVAALVLLLCISLSPAVRTSASILSVAVGEFGGDCDVWCSECDPGEHDAWEPAGEPNATRNGGVHLDEECWSGTCDTKHGPFCIVGFGEGGAEFATVEQLRSSIDRHDLRGVEAITATHPNRVLVNAERSAIQVLSCTGDIVAHLPVPGEMIAAVAAE